MTPQDSMKENVIDCYHQGLVLIVDIGIDRDGYTSKEDLGELVDELVEIARQSLRLVRPQYCRNGKVYEYVQGVETEVEESRWSKDSIEWNLIQTKIKEKKSE